VAEFPPPRAILEGESVSIHLPFGGRETIVDEVIIVPPQQRTRWYLALQDSSRFGMYASSVIGELRKRGLEPAAPPTGAIQTMTTIAYPPTPTITGAPRAFSAADGERKISQIRVSVNGGPDSALTGLGTAHGNLVWIYVPGRGRYILSLTPRPALGFSRASEVRGGYLTVTVDGVALSVTSTGPIAPGSAPYVIYALHDNDFAPTASRQRELVLAGSVGKGEIALLRRDQIK
jgi:hypothetical protein